MTYPDSLGWHRVRPKTVSGVMILEKRVSGSITTEDNQAYRKIQKLRLAKCARHSANRCSVGGPTRRCNASGRYHR